jgi:hypothetical protein
MRRALMTAYYEYRAWRAACAAAGLKLKVDADVAFVTILAFKGPVLCGVWSPAGENGGWVNI